MLKDMIEFLLEFLVVRYPYLSQTWLSSPVAYPLGWNAGPDDLEKRIVLERDGD